MATVYDAPRPTARDEPVDNPGPLVGVVDNDARSGAVDEIDTSESVELPGADRPVSSSRSGSFPNRPMSSAARAASWFSTATATPGSAHDQPIRADCA
jgi:hypothetical protein